MQPHESASNCQDPHLTSRDFMEPIGNLRTCGKPWNPPGTSAHLRNLRKLPEPSGSRRKLRNPLGTSGDIRELCHTSGNLQGGSGSPQEPVETSGDMRRTLETSGDLWGRQGTTGNLANLREPLKTSGDIFCPPPPPNRA